MGGEGQHSDAPAFRYSKVFLMIPMTESDETTFVKELKRMAGLRVKVAEPLARYTTMKIGGPADYFIEAQTETALTSLLPLLHRQGTPFCLLGNGSNVLISDRGIRGVVIHLAGEFKRVEWNDARDTVRVQVG